MSNPTTGSGACAPRIRRSRSGWTWTLRLALAVLACGFAGAGQAQTVYRGGLDEAVRELARTLVNEAGLRDKRVLVKSEDFFEMGTELRLELSEMLRGMSVSELTRSGVSVSMPGSDEDAVRVLHGRWRRESDTLLYLELFVAAPVESGDPTALRSAKGRVPIDENIRKAIESTLEDWGRLLMLDLERRVRDQRKRRVLFQPVTLRSDMVQGGRLEEYLGDWIKEAFAIRRGRLFTLIAPPPGRSVETDGTLHAKAAVHLRYVEVSLSVLDNQTFEQVTFAKVRLDQGLFPSSVVGSGDEDDDDVPDIAGSQRVPGGTSAGGSPGDGEDSNARLARCAGHVEAGRSAEAVKCHAGVLKEAPGDQGALAGLEDLRGTKFRDCDECPEVVVVPSGTYEMGSPSGEASRDDDEGRVHRVTFERPLAVGVYEVTFGEWDACVSDNGCGGYRPDDRGWGRGRHPVIYVNWDDAKAYVGWLSEETGEEYRLLSESEWEYVARAGTTGPFHTGSTISTERANYHGAFIYGSGRKGQFRKKTIPVGSFPANGFGLHDVHGNVWEWVEDCYSDGYVGAPVDGSAWEWNCDRRVLRGGSWLSGPRHLRSANRYGNSTGHRGSGLGFRVARTLTP